MSGAAAVEVRDLRRTFAKDVVAVNDVSFTVLAGESVGLVGESGSGKTTIARLVYGLDRPTSGTVAVCGNDRSAPPSNKDERRRRARELQMVFQNPYTSLDPRQPVAECLAEVVQFHRPGADRSQRSQRVAQLIDLVGLTGSQSKSVPRTLSGGQRQRVAIARALAADPAVCVLDEPVSALDVSVQAQILNLLADVREETGITYLLISHDLGVVRQMVDRCLVLRRGEIVEQGAADDVLSHPSHPYTQRLKASIPRPGWNPELVSVGDKES